MGKLDIDSHLAVVGNFGRHQWISLFLTGFLVITFAAQIFSSVFTRFSPPFKCIDDEYLNSTDLANVTFSYDCFYPLPDGKEKQCTKFEYDRSIFEETIVTKFDLVCGRQYMNTAIGMAWMASVGLGALVISYLSDTFIGRKPVAVILGFGASIIGSIVAFSVNYSMFMVFTCVLGLVIGCAFTSCCCLMMESVAPNKRSHALNALEFFWVFGGASLSLIAYVLRSWWKVQLFISAPALLTGIAAIWLLDESPHWLHTIGKHEQAIHVLNNMASRNNIEHHIPENLAESSSVEKKNTRTGPSENICKIWVYYRLLARVVIISLGWASCALCYYSLSLGVGSLGGDLFVNNFIMCAVEIFSYTYCFGVAWWGRKWPTVAVFQLAGLSLLIMILLTEYAAESVMAITVLSMVGKFAVSAAWQCVIVWGSELAPTSIRCTTVAINNLSGKIGSVLAPLMIDLPKLIDVPKKGLIMPSLFVVLMVGIGLLHIIPPETNKCKIPDNMADANQVSFLLVAEGKNDSEDEKDQHDGLLMKENPAV